MLVHKKLFHLYATHLLLLLFFSQTFIVVGGKVEIMGKRICLQVYRWNRRRFVSAFVGLLCLLLRKPYIKGQS